MGSFGQAILNVLADDNIEAIDALINARPDALTIVDGLRKTLLHIAVTAGAERVVNLLIKRGADVHARDRYNRTPLGGLGSEYVRPNLEENHCHIIDRLVEAGADINSEDEFGNTAAFYAARNGKLRILDTLVDHGADVHGGNSTGITCFHVATLNSHVEMMERLRELKVDINAQDNQGRNAVFEAVGRPELLKMVIEWGVEPCTEMEEGECTPLIHAVWNCRCEESVRILLDAGVDTSPTVYRRKYEENFSALDIAKWKGLDTIAKMIEDYDRFPTVKGALEIVE